MSDIISHMGWFQELFSNDPALFQDIARRVEAHDKYRATLGAYRDALDRLRAVVDDAGWQRVHDLESALADRHALVQEVSFDAGFALGLAHPRAGDPDAVRAIAGIVFDQRLSHAARVRALLGALDAITHEMEQGFHLDRS